MLVFWTHSRLDPVRLYPWRPYKINGGGFHNHPPHVIF